MGDSAGAIDMEHTHTNGIEQQQPVKVTAEQLGVSQGEQYQGDLHFDLGNMMACEQGPIDRERFQREPDAACQELATQITQSLVAQLFQLPSEAAPVGRIAQLPPPSTPLPRAKPLPKPREPTKWEAFAQRKGIVKRKRGKEVFDEEAGEYRRRHGYKRAGDEAEVPIIEASASDAVGDDPFSALKAEKKERVREQHKRQLSNLKASAKAAGRGAAALPPTLRLAAGLPAHGKGRLLKRAEVKEDIKAASAQAGVSTASMGKFDERLAGEKPGERTAGRKRQKFEAVAGRTKAENEKALGVVDRILRERADDILDTDRAVRRVEAERHRHIGSNSGGRDQDDSDDDDGKGSKKKQHGRKGGKPTSTKGQRFAGLKRGDGGVAKRGGKGRPAPGSKGRPSPGGKGRPAPGGRGAAGKGRPAGRGGGRGGKRQ